jgi:hypothetical protein
MSFDESLKTNTKQQFTSPFGPNSTRWNNQGGRKTEKGKSLLRTEAPYNLAKTWSLYRTRTSTRTFTMNHQGRGITNDKLRSLGYWIVGRSKAVAHYIRQCIICRKLRRPTETNKMSDLPKARVQPTPPFTHCDMDCFGPFLAKNGRKEVKRYGLLFTCICSRGIHIEMLDDMSTDSFINGLRCFIAIRRSLRQIQCVSRI